MDDFIAKPVSLTTLGFVLQRWTAPSATESRFATAAGAVRHEGGINEGARATGSTPRSIDIEVLRRLVEELDDSLLVVTVARTFLRELGGRVGALDRAITDDDRSALVAAAHTLKSTSAVVGAGTLSQLCQRLEQTARNSATVALPVTAREIQEEAAAVERDLEAALAVIYDGPHP